MPVRDFRISWLSDNIGHFDSAGLKVDDEEYQVTDQPGVGEYLDAE